MNASEQPVRLRVSPLVYLAAICAGVLLLTMVGLLVAQLAVLKDSRAHIQAQDHKIATLQGEGRQALKDARPAIDQVEPLLRRARSLLTPAGQSFDSLTEAADAVPRLAAGADVLLAESIPLLQALNASDAPAAIHATGHLALALTENHRAIRAIDATNRVLASIESESLIPRSSRALTRFEELLVDIAQIQRRTLRTQKLSLRTQRRQVNLTFESVRIQRELLEHTRSIDRKTPPLSPTAAPTPPVTPAAP
jgi:hypothetical protein